MRVTQLEVSLSKEERRIVDEYGNSASTWARIGLTAEMDEGDDVPECIIQLRELIQPQVDDWLLRQGGYITPPREEIKEIEEVFEADVETAEVANASDEIPE